MRARGSGRLEFTNFVVSPPVQTEMVARRRAAATGLIPVIISLQESKTDPGRGVIPAREAVIEFLKSKHQPVRYSDFYVFASLPPEHIEELAAKSQSKPDEAATDLERRLINSVYQIWNDQKCQSHLLSSAETLKAPACWRAFEARGSGITWAVLDTGIKTDHPHFKQFKSINTVLSRNFTGPGGPDDKFEDDNGHGTHVAGIIAGVHPAENPKPKGAAFVQGKADPEITELPDRPSGVAPMAKLIAVKVLDKNGEGSASATILGLEYVRKLNEQS